MAINRRHRPLFFFLTLLVLAEAHAVQWLHIPRPPTLASVQPVRPAVSHLTPVRVRIPRIGVDAIVQPMGLTQAGRMDVPTNPAEVGWFRLGTQPGERGSAVLAGHLDTVSGNPGVFWRLQELTAGDTIIVADAEGQELRFRVRESLVYDERRSPLERIFGSTEGRFLNLITCDGVWLRRRRDYDKRLVVFTELQTTPVSAEPIHKAASLIDDAILER